MANYGNELLENFIKAWMVITTDDNSLDPDDFELKPAWLDFECAGRYSLKFRNQGFDTSGFGIRDADTGKNTCPFWKYVTSPDVNYYDAEFKTLSKPAYDIALYFETFSDSDAFTDFSNALGDLFAAVKRKDANRLFKAASRAGTKLSPDGRISIDCADRYGLVLTIDVFPAAAV